MKVHLYTGSLKVVQKSGVGQAIYHQKDMLVRMGVKTVFTDDKDAKIVHINTVFPDSFRMACIAKRRHQKVVYYGHSTMEDFRNSFKGSNLVAPIFRRWIIFCYEQGDIIITPTEYSKELLQSYGIKKSIYSLSNGIDTTFFHSSKERRIRFRMKYHIKETEQVVMSVGHYIERKGILDYIELARKMPETRFFWFGYTNMKLIPKNIQSAIKNAPLNLTFPGYMEREDLCDAYCGCDLFAFMSQYIKHG
jgi:1,2-diacylglycerol-3-alpha-glucose alpha-1,2-glucosyltransferase